MAAILYCVATVVFFVHCVCGLNETEWTTKILKNIQDHMNAYRDHDFAALEATYTSDVHFMLPRAPMSVGINATMAYYHQADESVGWVTYDKCRLEYLRWFCEDRAVAELGCTINTTTGYIRQEGILGLYRLVDGEAKAAINIFNVDM